MIPKKQRAKAARSAVRMTKVRPRVRWKKRRRMTIRERMCGGVLSECWGEV
jgi:hypothetical protein